MDCLTCGVWRVIDILKCPIYQKKGTCPYFDELLRKEKEEMIERGAPVKHVERLYDGYKDTKVTSIVKAHVKDVMKGHALVLIGPVGIGKTFGAVMAMRAMVRWRGWGVYVNARDVERKHKRVKFLVLDDLGVEGEEKLKVVQELIEYRYDRWIPTMITTNIPWEKWRFVYGERIVDRMREWGIIYQIAGKSLRK